MGNVGVVYPLDADFVSVREPNA